ncbi:hypothetical protein FHS85_000888 [Rhodoligotrophos appendicifer]|uniref:NADP-dependent oxidoreductase n=1 Tax=Rhodoligotrophos appendicifer TaxID=987056 RepID=UPI00118056FF|nr:NADP-dependent oxidoreductase [Rhodoligotrophos appendicifer]
MNRQIVLKARPVGLPKPSDFELLRAPVPEPASGQFVTRNTYLGLAPAARIRMSDGDSYAPPTPLGSVIYGQTAGTVVSSRHAGFAIGEKVVITDGGWQDYSLSDGSTATKIDEAKAPLTHWLGSLGVSGLTAYIGLLVHGRPQPGETVIVSAAAGAVGSMAGQIARIKGCRVVGIAGGDRKCAYVRDELGFDDCIDYRSEDFTTALAAACSSGADIFFDNVGGQVRNAVMPRMNLFGRIVVCGMISEYNGASTAGPSWFPILTQRLTIRGFLMRDHMDHQPQFIDDVSHWLQEDRIVMREDIAEGLESAPCAFLRMLQGQNFGKTLVRL